MPLFQDWWGMFVITFLCWLGWFSGIVLGQFGVNDTLSSSVSFPEIGLTCFGNLAVFFFKFFKRQTLLGDRCQRSTRHPYSSQIEEHTLVGERQWFWTHHF